MSLPRPPQQYSQQDQERLRADLQAADEQNRKKGQDVEIVGSERLIKSSANGSRWDIVVADDGTISAVAL